MRILIVAATGAEVVHVVGNLEVAGTLESNLVRYAFGVHEVHVLLTGVGMVGTAAWCSRALTRDTYELALNIGICGSFDRAIALGRVVHVTSDRLVELGAEDDAGFIPLEELSLGADARPEIWNLSPPANRALDSLPRVTGITVNTVHGRDASIAALLQRCSPQVESMEGAAFMYACTIHGLPFAQVRAVSNFVERRNREAWKIPLAVSNLGEQTVRILETL